MKRRILAVFALAFPLFGLAAGIDRTFFKDLLEVPSKSPDATAVNRAVALTHDWLRRQGVACAVETNAAGRTALYASTRPGKVQDYLLVTHLDVVTAGPEQFKPRFEGDRVFARGAHDCKGNAVLAAQVLKDLNGKASVGAVFAGDEEIGGLTTKMMVERGYGAKKLIVILDAGTYGVFYAEKGNYYFRVRAVGKGGHSCAAMWLKNPIDRLSEGYLKFMAAWPKPPADGWGDVISATLVSAGEAENRIPDTAEMTLNLRSVTADAPERAAKLLKEAGLEVVSVDESAKPVTSDMNDPEIVRFLEARKAFWPEKKPGFQKMIAATDARHFATSGVPIVITGSMGSNAHAQGEWADLKNIDENVEMLERYFFGGGANGQDARSTAEATLFKAADYASFRQELRAFYPDECHGDCKDPRQTNSVAAIGRELDAWAAAHPGFDALDIRRESYLLMRKHFVPFLFRESPFYFEAGCNGGWCYSTTAVPSRHVNRICSRFYREKGLIPDSAFGLQHARNRETLALCCGPFSDDMHHVAPFRKILKVGFSGVRAEVAAALAKCPADDALGRKELETALVGFDTVHAMQLAFAKEAKKRLESAVGGEERKRLLRIAEAAERCPWEPPRTFFEGLNTLWFVRESLGYADGVCQNSLGRPDAWLIDLYRADLKAGRLTVEEARELVAKFLLTAECHHDGTIPVHSYSDHEMEIPMSLGGCDKNGVWVNNELTKMFFAAHLECDCVFPKLHCRISANAPRDYLETIGDMLMKGHAVFTLLNDDRHIPQYVADGFPLEDAREFSGQGCWQGYIDSVMDVDGANYLSILKIVEMTVHRDPAKEAKLRMRIDPIDDAQSIGEVRDILYRNTLRFCRDIMGEYTRWGGANAQVFPHPTYSMCLRGCVESRRDTMDRGVPPKARPKVVTLGFIGNVVDSIAAINQICFVDKVCTVREYLDAVRSNWAGEKGEALRRRAMRAPYWGDGSRFTTDELAWWMRSIRRDTADLRSDQGGDYKLAIYTYREFMYWGAKTKATPDGRRNGDNLAQGFSPSEAKCHCDVPTLMNAIGELPHDCLFASNVNLTFDRSAMSKEILAAILQVFCEKGSHMIQPNCNSVEELLDAQRHPERHQNLIVRVCGFSAKFIYLSKPWQDEVIARHRLRP